MPVPEPLPLCRLQRDQCAIVEELCGCQDTCERLAAMGLSSGALVRMLAPGNPCAVQVGECRLMLRGPHTEAIRVCPLEHVA